MGAGFQIRQYDLHHNHWEWRCGCGAHHSNGNSNWSATAASAVVHLESHGISTSVYSFVRWEASACGCAEVDEDEWTSAWDEECEYCDEGIVWTPVRGEVDRSSYLAVAG